MKTLASLLLAMVACSGSQRTAQAPGAGSPPPTAAAAATSAPTNAATAPAAKTSPAQVVQLYLDATSSGELDNVASLMLDSSAIFESGGNEGTWQHYREHHLGPEIKAIAKFEIRPEDKQTTISEDKSLALVTFGMEYDIDLVDKRRVESKAVATFVLRLVDGEYRIAHVHWSSRPRAPGAGH